MGGGGGGGCSGLGAATRGGDEFARLGHFMGKPDSNCKAGDSNDRKGPDE